MKSRTKTIAITLIDPALPRPRYQTAGAVCFDIYTRRTMTVRPGALAKIPTNLIIAVPEGYALLILARSSLAETKGLILSNALGIIDTDYHGAKDEIKLAVYNFSKRPARLKRGERLAQGLLTPIIRARWKPLKQAAAKSRGGFGSTSY